MDPSYLTRVVARLQRAGLVTTQRSDVDRRHVRLALDAGRTGASPPTSIAARRRRSAPSSILSAVMTGGGSGWRSTPSMSILRCRHRQRSVTVRGLDSGDLGWVIQRHGEIYHDEYGWDISFEALVAEIVSTYFAHHRPGREQAWIAEVDGARAGCVFCCQRDDETAQLRILLVEPSARGLGIGQRLVRRVPRLRP